VRLNRGGVVTREEAAVRQGAERRARVRRRIRRPPGHWTLLAFFVVTLVVLLGVQGLSTQTTGVSGTGTPDAASPLEGSRSLLSFDGRHLRSYGPPRGRRVALTFDDGPSSQWTPSIVAELARLHAPATFFVVGSEAARHPDLIRRLHDHGFELGNHTFTHVDLATVPGWQRRLQLDLTDGAVAGVTGRRTRLVRPPYSATPAAVATRQLPALVSVARRGYLIALSDLDSEDWRRPGVDAIVRNATPRSQDGGLVLLHDGGGDRSQTAAAVARLVPELRARGFELVTVGQLAGLAPRAVEVPAHGWEHLRGRLLLATLAVARTVTDVMVVLLVGVAVLALMRALVLASLARRHARSVRRESAVTHKPPVSIIVPAYNEAVGIARALRSLAASEYPDFEIIVVDDGSVDATPTIADSLRLPNTRVISQTNAGKAAALNRGLAAAGHQTIAMVDADTVFEPDTLMRLVQPLRDPDVGAVAGNTKVGNRRGLIGRWQHIEYVLGFNLDRRMYDVLQCMPTVPGAIGAFRREALAAIGGVSTATLAEDTDITIAIGRKGWRVVYAEDARAWTEAPASLGALWRQRYRWSYGTMQAVWKHRAALWHPKEKRIGRRGLPYLVLFQIALPLLAPLVDVFALYGVAFLNPLPVVTYWMGFNALQLALGWYAFRLDGESRRVLWALPLQQLVYRQLMYLVVIESVASALLGLRLRWQHLERTGEVEVAS
jgi:cellulose synthase/poly-beta-1,6-N-acetylglucosamine synthase-like glycosyltransferase/peptidoglycan/xylan/chitin deacetylase (PgdA/CDA1 family)